MIIFKDEAHFLGISFWTLCFFVFDLRRQHIVIAHVHDCLLLLITAASQYSSMCVSQGLYPETRRLRCPFNASDTRL